MASPTVKITERTFEATPLVTAGMTAVILGTANKGELETLQVVGSLDTFRELYGTQTSLSFLNFAVKKYLQNSSALIVARAGISAEAVKSSIEVEDAVSSGSVLMNIEALTTGDDGDEVSVKFTRAEDLSGEPTTYGVEILHGTTIKESYTNINLDDNSDTYIEEVINGISAYIEITVEDPLIVDPIITETNTTVTLTGGVNGDVDNVGTDLMDSYIAILEQLKNKDTYTFDVVIIPDYSYTPAIATKLAELVNYRNDCVAIVDSPQGLGLLAESVAVQSAIDFTDGTLANSIVLNNKNIFNFAYWQKDYDEEDAVYKWYPPSIYVLSKFAEITRNYASWFPIAGVSNGRLLTVDTELSPSKAQRDLLYGDQLNGAINVVNPIVKDNVDGMLIWGQRTTERSLAPTNRINVIMMLNFLKQRLYRIGKRLQFSINNPNLWNKFKREANNVLVFIQSNYGIDNYTVVADETTNTPTVIANNQFMAKIKVTPSAIAEDIEIILETTPQNVSVTES